jgi:hypothetical protein
MDNFKQMKSNPGALVNVDVANYNSYWLQRRSNEADKNKLDEINILKNQINEIASEQLQIKDLLIKLLEKK